MQPISTGRIELKGRVIYPHKRKGKGKVIIPGQKNRIWTLQKTKEGLQKILPIKRDK